MTDYTHLHRGAHLRLVMMGTGTFAQPTLEALLKSGHQIVALVTQPDRAVGQQRGSTRLAERGMKHIALEHKIPVFQPESVNSAAGVAGLRSFSPDLLVVAAYGQILSRDVLATAAQGGINVHASLLPAYRGAAPIAWAIYHGEMRTGVTIIRMSIYLDAGDILAQEPIDILPNETAGELEARLGPLGAHLAVNTVERLAVGPVAGVPQDKSRATKAPKLTKEHGLIDWTKNAEQVRNHIRAMQPWPTAYTFLHRAGQPPLRVILSRANVRSDLQANMFTPGEAVSNSSPHHLVIGAALGTCVEVVELQPAGKRRMPAAEFLRGHPLRPGDRFGPE
jgi:methionyl-tRNA formyltransferase